MAVDRDLNNSRREHPEASGSARMTIESFEGIDATLGEMGETLKNNNKTLRKAVEILNNYTKTLDDIGEHLRKKDEPSKSNYENFKNNGETLDLEQTETTLTEIDETLRVIGEGLEEENKPSAENKNTQNNAGVKIRDAHELQVDPKANATKVTFAYLNLRRHLHLQKGCQGLKAEPWYRMDYRPLSQVLDVCVSPKVRFR